MSRQLTITAPGLGDTSTTGGTYTRPLTGTNSFSAVPSNTFTEGWIVHRATLSIRVWSYGWLTSGDVWVRITNNAGTMTDLFEEINPFKGSSHSCSVLSYVSSRGDFTNVSVRFNSTLSKTVGFSGLQIYYLGLPYRFSVSSNGNGSVSYSHDGTTDTSIKVTASPSTGYKFSHWSDGSTANPYIYDPGEVESASLSATFVPIGYTVNYYDYTSGEEVFLKSQACEYGTSYDVYPLPNFDGVIPEGHDVNNGGWIRSTDNACIRNGTQQAYNINDLTSTVTMCSATFKNLTIQDGDVVNLVYKFYPKSYSVNYISYTALSDTPTSSIVYRVYGNGNYTLKNLPEAVEGYKLTNKMPEKDALIDTTITNAWFTSTTNPGDEKLTFIESSYADDIIVYSNEIPISYTVNYYDCSSGEEILISSEDDYLYNEVYNYLPLPEVNTIPQGFSPNPTGWIKIPNAIIRYSDKAVLNNQTSLTVQSQYYGTFSNLTKKDKDIINYYFNLHPYYYKISYINYIKGITETSIGQDFYVFNEVEEINLRNLSAASKGYKLINQIDPETNRVNLDLINNLFVDNNDIKPGKETKTVISQSELTQDLTFYQSEMPIGYKIKYYNNEELLLEQDCEYDKEYIYLDLPVPEISADEGHLYNPTGWIPNVPQGTIRNNTTNIYKLDNLDELIPQYIGTFINLKEDDGEIIELFFNQHPIHYLVNYTKYEQGDTSIYTLQTDYRIYGQEYNTVPLPKNTDGYKFTNKMETENGPETIPYNNVWFTSNTNLTPSGDKVIQVPSTLTSDINLYSFEVPKNFILVLNVLDYSQNKIKQIETLGKFGISYPLNGDIEELTGYSMPGWYTTEKNIDGWHIESNTNILNGDAVELTINDSYSAPGDIIDQSIINYYGYYIPYSYYISYNWLDEYGVDSPDYRLPEKVIRIYGTDNVLIETIPSYENYDVDNANTQNWYYYQINEETGEEQQLINERQYIDAVDQNNYDFYALKHPHKRHITFGISNEYFGTISINNQAENDLYDEGDIITVSALPTEIAYFSNWSDKNNETVRQIVVGSEDKHYVAVFRSNQVYINSLGILGAYKNTTLVKQIDTPNAASWRLPTYTITNRSSTYGFYLNNNNYYESNNKGKSSSYAVCRVTINAPNEAKMYIDCINYAESTYDFGLLSKLNTSLALSNSADSSSKVQKSFSGSQSASIQTVSYTIPKGTNFIDIKYRKDSSVNSNNDSLQFKIRFEEV